MLYLLFQNESSKIYTLGKQMLQSGWHSFWSCGYHFRKTIHLILLLNLRDTVTIVWWSSPKDEDFIVNFINSTALVKFIIAPQY
jgi:hypothetical protein